MIEYLTLEEILLIHSSMIKRFGGLKGVRDKNLLHSVIELPKSTMFGEDLHPGIFQTLIIPFTKNKVIFNRVGLATNFWSSLAPCHSAMVARSRHKNLCCLLAKYDFIFCEWYKAIYHVFSLQATRRPNHCGL